MLDILKARLLTKKRTISFPSRTPALPGRFRGLPVINSDACAHRCTDCIQVCPAKALSVIEGQIQIDMGKCIFCGDCVNKCKTNALRFSRDYRLATTKRQDLVFSGSDLHRAEKLGSHLLKLYGRSFKLRQVSAGGCNGCEVDINVLTTSVYDIGRFGLQIVASPRHADGLLVTGPVTQNMREALLKTYEAVPPPKIVIAVGACSISGALFSDMSGGHAGVDQLFPVHLYIPGCPPHPLSILDGLLRLIGKMKNS